MKKVTNYLIVSAVALLWVSCSSTPQTRIEKDPGTFESLSPDEQTKVQDGKISKGMSKEAVRLALGEPDSVSEGASSSGGDYEEWQYYGLSARYAPSFGIHTGFGGFGRRRFRGGFGVGLGGYGCGYGGFGLGGGVSYAPRLNGIVRFSGGYVDEFKSRSSN